MLWAYAFAALALGCLVIARGWLGCLFLGLGVSLVQSSGWKVLAGHLTHFTLVTCGQVVMRDLQHYHALKAAHEAKQAQQAEVEAKTNGKGKARSLIEVEQIWNGGRR